MRREAVSQMWRGKGVKVLHLKTLSVRSMLKFVRNNTNIEEFLSDFNYQKSPNRELLWNLLNIILWERFREFIQSKQQERAEYITERKEMKVRALPEFIKRIKDSKSISSKKRRSHFLIKGLENKKWGNHAKNSRELLVDVQRK